VAGAVCTVGSRIAGDDESERGCTGTLLLLPLPPTGCRDARAASQHAESRVCVCVITCCFRASSAVLAVVSSSSRAQTKSNDVVVVGSRDGDSGALPREKCIERKREGGGL
jgi:hypothetical protein